MKLVEFKPDKRELIQPTISLYKNGAIHLSTSLVKRFCTQGAEKIRIYQDEEEPSDWYLGFDSEEGIQIRKFVKKSKNGDSYDEYLFACKPLVDSIKSSIKKRDSARWTIPVSTTPDPETGLYALITSALR